MFPVEGKGKALIGDRGCHATRGMSLSQAFESGISGEGHVGCQSSTDQSYEECVRHD